jgi:hypothetical protein
LAVDFRSDPPVGSIVGITKPLDSLANKACGGGCEIEFEEGVE